MVSEDVTVIEAALGFCTMVVTAFTGKNYREIKDLREDNKGLAAALAHHEVKVAENYASKKEIESISKKIDETRAELKQDIREGMKDGFSNIQRLLKALVDKDI